MESQYDEALLLLPFESHVIILECMCEATFTDAPLFTLVVLHMSASSLLPFSYPTLLNANKFTKQYQR